MKTFTLHKIAIIIATLAIGSAVTVGNTFAASHHSPQTHKSAKMKQDCKAMSWEIPTQTQGTPEMTTPCAMHGTK